MAICKICGKYSSHSNEVKHEKFRVDGIDYFFDVCGNSLDGRFSEHLDAQERIEEIVRADIKRRQDQQNAIEAEQKRLEEKRQKDMRELQERTARETDERTYKTALYNFDQLTQGNDRAMKEIYRRLKHAYESGEQ